MIDKLKLHYKVWKANKILSLCVIVGLLSVILFYLLFDEILWMGVVCLSIGIGGLYRKFKK